MAELNHFNRKLYFLNNHQLRELFINKTPFIDVRAPVEFKQGHLPDAVNIPILNDEERALVGTTYKNKGNEAAVKLGHELVSGETKTRRLDLWQNYIKENPRAILYCFRGGQRSQITQKWLKEVGVDRPLIKGGYKFVRNFLMDEVKRFSESYPMLIVSGTTGSGKTQFLQLVKSFYPSLDLEGLACHRGSAFGSMGIEQPTQINFENLLAASLIDLELQLQKKHAILIEDESHMIGKCSVPKHFFDKMRASPVLWIDETLEVRVRNIFKDYILDSAIGNRNFSEALLVFARYKKAVQNISKKLGGLRAQEILTLLEQSENNFKISEDLEINKVWIEKLLVYYYDPMYLGSLERRQVQVLFKGRHGECADFLKHQAVRGQIFQA